MIKCFITVESSILRFTNFDKFIKIYTSDSLITTNIDNKHPKTNTEFSHEQKLVTLLRAFEAFEAS